MKTTGNPRLFPVLIGITIVLLHGSNAFADIAGELAEGSATMGEGDGIYGSYGDADLLFDPLNRSAVSMESSILNLTQHNADFTTNAPAMVSLGLRESVTPNSDLCFVGDGLGWGTDVSGRGLVRSHSTDDQSVQDEDGNVDELTLNASGVGDEALEPHNDGKLPIITLFSVLGLVGGLVAWQKRKKA